MGFANSSKANRFWLCPLYSFNGYSESVELAEGIQIKAISVLPGLSKYIQGRSRGLYGQWDNPSEYNAVLLLPYHAGGKGVSGPTELARIGYLENDRARDLLFDLVTALRLCHEGKITAGPLISSIVKPDSGWSFGGTTVWTLVSKRDFLHQDPEYALNQSDVPLANELVGNLAKLRKLEKLDAINIALRRFNSAYHGYIEDRIIDQMIAFESLYIGGERGIKKKLAERTASLLGGGQASKDKIFDEMKDAYKKRCDLVHVIKDVTREELGEIVPKTEEYLRLSIRKFLSLLSEGKSLEDIRNKLEKISREWNKS